MISYSTIKKSQTWIRINQICLCPWNNIRRKSNFTFHYHLSSRGVKEYVGFLLSFSLMKRKNKQIKTDLNICTWSISSYILRVVGNLRLLSWVFLIVLIGDIHIYMFSCLSIFLFDFKLSKHFEWNMNTSLTFLLIRTKK